MTGEKTTVRFTEAVKTVVAEWKLNGWTPQELVNTAIMLFHMSTPEEREKAKKYANRPPGPLANLSPVDQYKARMLDTIGLPANEEKDARATIWKDISGDPRLDDAGRLELAEKMRGLPTTTQKRRAAGL